jgi:hypothetical protein
MNLRIQSAKLLAALVASLTCISVPAQTFAADSAPGMAASAATAKLDALKWLVGGTWRCDGTSLPGKLDRIETRYELAPNGRLIRFTTAFVMQDGSVPNGYAGNFYVDPATRGLRGWYLDTNNEETQGAVAGDAEHWAMTFNNDGAIVGRPGMMEFKADVTRTSADSYDWKLLAHVGDAWKPVFALTYRRTT